MKDNIESHYHFFIPSISLNQLYKIDLPIKFWKKIFDITLKLRFLVPLHAKYPHSKYIENQLIHGSLENERKLLENELNHYLNQFVENHWKEIHYKVGERVYAEYEGEWYVAIIENVFKTNNIKQTSQIQQNLDNKDPHGNEHNVIDDSNIDIFSNDKVIINNNPNINNVQLEQNENESQEEIYHLKFIGYGNESDAGKLFIKPYIDIPSEYLKPQTPLHALYYEDNQLYEAIVDRFMPDTNTVIVKFTGYGNKQDTELYDIRVLTNEAKNNFYKYEAYTLYTAQLELRKDANERFEIWSKMVNQELDQNLKDEILQCIEKEIRGELIISKKDTEILKIVPSSEILLSESSLNQSKKEISNELDKKNKKRGGKRKREEKEVEIAASNWKNWKNKSSKWSSNTEKISKKAAKISEMINQIEEPSQTFYSQKQTNVSNKELHK